jgi:hypothetical protein
MQGVEYDDLRMDFPIAELLDNSRCLMWLERHLQPGSPAVSRPRTRRAHWVYDGTGCIPCDNTARPVCTRPLQ